MSIANCQLQTSPSYFYGYVCGYYGIFSSPFENNRHRLYFGFQSFQKPNPPMNSNLLFSLCSVLCFALPVLVIVLFKLYRHTSLIALMLYYGLTIVHCLCAEAIPPVPNFSNPLDVAYTYLEVPLILCSLLFFCHVRQRRLWMQRILLGFIAYEGMVSLYFKFSPQASLWITAPGLAMVIGYASYLFIRQTAFTILHGKNAGRVLMLGAILFAYGSYGLVFYTYFVQKQTDIYTVYALYFISSTVASLLMSAGLFMVRHRIRELQELKIVRKELQIVFGG